MKTIKAWTLAATALVLLAASAGDGLSQPGQSARAPAGLITKKSAHSVTETLDRLERLLKTKGIPVVARVRHSEAARAVGTRLRPTELLIFGNPKLGSLLMTSNQLAGIDLPMKVLAWEDKAGLVWLTYVAPAALASRHGIADREEAVRQMTGALGQLTDAAAAP